MIQQGDPIGIVRRNFHKTMSEQNSEPEKYSLDEMVSHLKGRENGENPEGELVRRSDGSQAMKVRKRRRRTNQTGNKETRRNQRLHVIQITGFVVVIAVVGLAAGIGIIYANSTSFREGLASKLETASGAQVELNQFRMNPSSANAVRANLEWPEGNTLSSLQVVNVKAEIAPASFFGKTFSGEEIVATAGDLVLRAPVAGEPIRSTEVPKVEKPVRFSRYSVPLMNIFFGVEKRTSNMLEKTEVSLFPGGVPGRAELRFNGGLFKADGWPSLALDRSYMNFSGKDLEIKSLRFELPLAPDQKNPDRGSIQLSGTVQPLDPNASHTLAVKLDSFMLSPILGADLGRFFHGRLETVETPKSNFLLVTPGIPEPAKLELAAKNALDSRIDLSGFAFLPVLSKVLKDEWYLLPNFDDEVSLLITREGDAWI